MGKLKAKGNFVCYSYNYIDSSGIQSNCFI